MGVTWATFHSFGNIPKMRERLNSSVMAGAILDAVYLSILADILSGPLALEGINGREKICHFFYRAQEVLVNYRT